MVRYDFVTIKETSYVKIRLTSFFQKNLNTILETGLFRLMGHVGPVSNLTFIPSVASSESQWKGIISSSHDGLVKVWNLQEQRCIQTIANHGGPVSCSSVVDLLNGHGNNVDRSESNRCRLVTGCADGKVRVYEVTVAQDKDETLIIDETKTNNDSSTAATANFTSSTVENDSSNAKEVSILKSDGDNMCFYMGTLIPPPNVATSNEKITNLHFHPNGCYFAYLRSNSKSIDVYSIRTYDEATQKKKRRLRRKREKVNRASKYKANEEEKNAKKRGILDDEEDYMQSESFKDEGKNSNSDDLTLVASDEFDYMTTLHASHKIKAFNFVPYLERNGSIRIICALSTNSLEVHSISKRIEKNESRKISIQYESQIVSSLDMYGHPTGIRSISLSSDDILACTISKNCAKIWNVGNRSCLRSLPIVLSKRKGSSGSYGLCSVFLPGDSHVVVGTKEGFLLIIDIASGEVVFSDKAHEKEIWSIDIKRPSANTAEAISIVTGSADRNVKFWDIETQTKDDLDDFELSCIGHPMLVHTRTLQTTDDVVAVRYSYSYDPQKRMVFVSTLDNQIKVFFDDTLKFFLSLYGHSLPALALDSSDDDAILASGGADKSIKIWGLDFGDTHRTLYGHTDSITDLRFVRKTHNFFTSSKDGTLRYWDGDRFNQVLLLNGHFSEVNCLALSKTGAFVLSGGMDRQVRVWERTRDMVFIEEEREREMEDMFDKIGNHQNEVGTDSIMRRRISEEELEEEREHEDNHPQSEAAVRRSVISVASGDRIMEALELADQELKDLLSMRKNQETNIGIVKDRPVNPLLLGMKPAEYILWVLRSIKSAELEQSLLVLPLHHMERLIYYLIVLLREGLGVELCSRVAVFLVKTHQNQVIGHSKLSTSLRELRRLLRRRLSEARDSIGYNLAAIRMIQKAAQEHKGRYHIAEYKEETIKPIFTSKTLGLGSEESEGLQRKKR